jgi:hypothetical protein
MVLGNAIGIPFQGNIITPSSTPESVTGLLNFDGIDDYVELSSTPDVTGSKTISFKLYISSSIGEEGGGRILSIGSDPTDFLSVNITNSYIIVHTDSNATLNCKRANITTLLDTILTINIVKSTTHIDSLTINGTASYTEDTVGTSLTPNGARIGSSTTDQYYNSYSYIWDININNEHAYAGQPNGNLDSAWVDTIGSINGTVYGSPTTINI